MKKLSSRSTTEEDTHKPDNGSTNNTPRWVKVFGIIAIVLVLFLVILHLTGRGFGDHGGHTPPSSVIEQGVKQP
ncbi:hypothetical protein P5G65_23270 [Paenibacillus chondroitinus]|uniref:Uncharacterized protein n=1 Tax=Paenibacillus chondroitinus TaxID=59842 RepID=A0ABU6DGH3_9BACL|nr:MULTISPECIES: hypothetical protein [Paenibacillus]MCY9659433.1 hypothetical protein [Paenibacillus anseongense]MEB4796828.1 hypothetical protein [Paenibacillus chondroitinus]